MVKENALLLTLDVCICVWCMVIMAKIMSLHVLYKQRSPSYWLSIGEMLTFNFSKLLYLD